MADGAVRSRRGDEIAVIGMGGRFPRARNVDEFWANLRAGVECSIEVTAEDLRRAGEDPAALEAPDYVRRVFALDDAEHFDAGYFGFSPREAEQLDPQHRLLLEAAAAALDNAGYDPERYPGLIGVFGGVGRNSYYMNALARHPRLFADAGEYHWLIGNERDFPTTHISYRLNLRGPSIDVQTACSTSGVAIHLACQSLRNGECDIALAGGAKVIIPNRVGYWYIEGGPLSPEGRIRAFDAKAKGMTRGSGAAMVALKRLVDAEADGDTIHGVLLGSAVNNDGGARVGFTAPSPDGQSAVISEALDVAGVSPETIDYVEAHGTGTVLGDPIEIAGLTQAYRRYTDRAGFCRIGSVKTNIGHLDAGATVAGLIKTLLAMKHGELPPSLNFETPNPEIDWSRTPFTVNAQLSPWPRRETPRRAGVSSFGLGGTNAHLIVEEAPIGEPSDAGRAFQVLPLSARTPAALETASDELASHLRAEAAPLADVALTLQVGRRQWQHRRIVVARDGQDASRALGERDAKQVESRDAGAETRSVVYMLPGAGSQYPRMAAALRESEPLFRDALEHCVGHVPVHLRPDVQALLAGPDESKLRDLERPSVAQSALFAVEYAFAQLWADRGLVPAALIGHSVGEYAAACLAGVLTPEDTIRLIALRGELFDRLGPSAMLSVPLSEQELAAVLDDRLSIAAVNRTNSCVASGSADAIDDFATQLQARGIESTKLHIAMAAHSKLADAILDDFGSIVASMHFATPQVPIISNVTGTWLSASDATDPAYWVRHLRGTVRFADGLATLLADPTRVLLEVGPGQTLATFARQHPARIGQPVITSSRHPQERVDDRQVLAQSTGRLWLAGVDIDWEALHSGERRHRVPLPTYPFQRERYTLVPDQDSDAPAPHAHAATHVPAAAPQPGAIAGTPTLVDASAPAQVAFKQEGPVPMSTETRRDRIVAELRRLLHEMSGVPNERLDGDTTFLELGFDSLFLARANAAFKKAFKVAITTRHLMERTPTLSTLAGHIDAELPADAFPAPQAATTSASAVAARESMPTPIPVTPALGADGSMTLESLIVQQMALMQAQLAALSGRAVDALPATPMAAAPPPVPAAPSPVAASSAGTAGTSAGDRGSPWQPVGKRPSEEPLTPAQRAYVDDLIARVNRRTPRAKQLTDANRGVLADPRTVQGFRRPWKEMIYPIVSDRAKGSRIWDIDGNEYIDLVNGYGVTYFGHSADFILDAVREQLERTVAIGPQTPLAGEVARLLCDMTGMDRAAFCNTGSEAVLAAIRVARTVTGKQKLAMFAGHYHGIFDEVLVKATGTGPERGAVPTSPGVPSRAVEDVVVLEYGNIASLDVIRRHARELALVMVEPVRSRNLDMQPKEFVQALRALTEELGIPLLFDEMITGFRAHQGGAQAFYGIRADLATYGKIIGGGFPIGVVAGKKEYLDALDGGAWRFGDDSAPEADMTWFAGTFVRHPLALAAARAVLTRFKEAGPSLQEELNRRTTAFVRALNEHFHATNAPIHIEHFASALNFTFTRHEEYAPLLFHELHTRGICAYEGRPAFLTLAHSDADLETIGRELRAAVALLQNLDLISGGPVRAADEPFELPLAEGQQEIWLATQLGEDASRAFNLASTLRLRGALRVDALESAVARLYARHESLRAVPNGDGQTQRVMPSVPVDLRAVDVSELADTERAARIDALCVEEVETEFDLSQGPLVRTRLIRITADDHLFILTAHHIIADGWSAGVLMRDLGALYESECTGEAAPLEPPMQLSEFVRQSNANRTSEERAQAEAFWIDQFQGSIPTLDLPTDRPRPARKTFRATRLTVPLEDAFVARARALASQQGSTLFSTLLAGFASLMHRLSGQEEVVVGFSVAGQAAITDRDLVGHCVTFLPLRLRPRGTEPFAAFLGRVRSDVLDALEYQNLAFGGLLQKLRIARDPSRVPLMSVAFNLDPSGRAPAFHDLAVESGSVPRRYENFDIFFNVVETGPASLELQCTYNVDLFDESTMRRMLDGWQRLIDGAQADPGRTLDELPLESSGAGEATAPQPVADERVLGRLFDEQAARTPDAVAVRFGSEGITYRELERRANRLAHHLRALGVGPETLVGLLLPRSIDLVVGVLGILKAGGAYVPVEPTMPVGRVAATFEDADVRVVVTDRDAAARVPSSVPAVVRVDADADAILTRPDRAPAVDVRADNAAYVIYTSGSTGRPKGVVVSHRNVERLFESTRELFDFSERDVWMLFHSIGFDFSVWEIWGALLYGGRLVVVPQSLTRSPEDFHDLLRAERVTVLNQTPSAFRMLMQADATTRRDTRFDLRYVIFGGEALELESLRGWIERRGDETPQLVNMYGITETTVHVTHRRIRAQDLDAGQGSVIGQPLPDMQLHLLDEHRLPVELGQPGEIWIGGAGVARGYLNRPQLTLERFVEVDGGARLYRSGDQGRKLANGDIEYLGRLDQQVKVRGFRIEPGEIEAQLRQHPRVDDVAVIADRTTGDARIVAYIVETALNGNGTGAHDALSAELGAFARARLPEYMVPSTFVALERLPLTENGKLDVRALPATASAAPPPAQRIVTPAAGTAAVVADVFREVLRVESIEADDDFFERGGHSLLAVQALVKLRDRLGVDIPLGSLFETPTAERLARRVDATRYASQEAARETASDPAEVEEIEL